MGKKWSLNFATQREENISIGIYKEGYDGQVIELTGSESPLSLNEETDDDIFLPSRCTTGYIEIIDQEGIDDIMPKNDKELYVKVECGGSILWQGWIKSDKCSRMIYETKSTLELPLQDALMVMDGVDMDSDRDMTMETLGSLITEAMASVDAEWTAIVYPKELTHGAADYDAWMSIQVNRRNWFEKSDSQNEDEPDYAKYERISYKALLEKIATMMGWTVTVKGTELWFVTTQIIAYERQTLSGQKSSISLTPQTLDSLDFSADGNEMTTCNGVRQVSVKAFVNPIQDVDIAVETKGRRFVRKNALSSKSGTKIKLLTYESNQESIFLNHYRVVPDSGDNQFRAEVEPYNPNRDSVSYPYYVVNHLVKADIYKQSDVDEGNKTSYQYTDAIFTFSKIPYFKGLYDVFPVFYPVGPVPIATFTGTELPPLEEGCLDLYFEIDSAKGKFDCKPIVEVRVGNKWWDDITKTWVSSFRSFDITCEQGNVKTNKTLGMMYNDVQHYVIPINSRIEGNVYLTISANDDIRKEAYDRGDIIYTALKGVSLRYCESESSEITELKDYNLLSAVKDNGFTEKKKIETDMATKTEACKNGLGIMRYNEALVTASTMRYQGRAMMLEQMLLAKMRRTLFRVAQIVKVTVECDMDSIPQIGESFIWNTLRCMVIAREINYRDNDVILTLYSLP